MSERDEFAAPPTIGVSVQDMGVERVAGVVNGGAEEQGPQPPPGPHEASAGPYEASPGPYEAPPGPHEAPGADRDEPPLKRARLPDDAGALRRKLLDAQLSRLRLLRDRMTEQLHELYFLQAGGNMMDYAVWRKRPPAPQLQAFVEARRPPPPETPPAPTPAVTPTPTPSSSAADEAVEKAKQEAYVAGRVAELARAGLWAERRLPRVLEPPRPKTHWDYLLEEMAWLAQDFAHERKWKKQAARKCARAVQKHFQDKALAAQKAEKARELQLKKMAAFAAKEIRTFWANAEKLAEWKRERRVERARKEALDEQLSYIVDRTERYSRQLAANLAPAPAPDAPPSDDEFQPRGASDDDEETIAAAERDQPDDAAAHRAELDALQRESRLSLADLLPPGYAPHLAPRRDSPSPRESPPPSDPRSDSDSEDESDASDRSDAASASGEGALSALVGAGAGDEERRVEEAASLAASLQPTGTTLSATAVATPVPRLLRCALREYQIVGLHWLATMHARGLNGILADEMGLGKTVQTIALLAHLALERGDWGPHLVVAPTSVVLNWEMEFKKWCPAFKLLTYYGTIRERKAKRAGWTRANAFHVCITSYKLVVQDHQSFRRKRWRYLVLDEAQNIKNFKSQRWRTLLNFQTERRLLLTGTPLQNSLLELWSLMHFLMPAVFASHSEFREWFGEVAARAEGGASDAALLRRLHAVLRPFLLRRLKRDVERQMPRKHEHVLLCRLARRQRALYDDFMARAKTRESLASGNLLSVINVLMQLRKVCNHPDLFEPRPVSSPLQLPALRLAAPALALLAGVGERARLAARLGGDLATLEAEGLAAFPAHRARHLAPPRRLIEELPPERPAPPRPPRAELRLHLRLVGRAGPRAGAPPPPAAVHLAAPLPDAAQAPAPAPAPRPSAQSAAATRLEARRRACLRRLAGANERRCWRLPLYGADLRRALRATPEPPALAALSTAPRLDAAVAAARPLLRFCVCVQAARAAAPQLCVGAGEGARAWRRARAAAEGALGPCARALLALLHCAAARQAVAFPHPSLLQYDCGKLQTLAALLRRLRAGGHRVLVFTQMTRVLDVLEAFLSLHGHAYLRLDGATRVERRQALVERFNADPRVFAMILSTRSGGVGLNLTGADAVVFYDSDWNPTMDAQAQDRAHRIGQTRDVHVYRLVTAGTVEENILRKANQKRALGARAIEDGHFTTGYLRAANIKELFGTETESTETEVADAEADAGGGALESALAAAEDEADAAAASAARAEAQRDLAEFDESLPLDDDAHAHAEPAPRDDLAALMAQLSPIEKYAMRVVESSEAAAAAESAALGEMRRQLREWEQARKQLREATPEPAPAPTPEPHEPLTYCEADARAQVWVSGPTGADRMPTWCPPTPPAGDGDVYCDAWARALYRRGPAGDALLPPARRDAPRRDAHARRARAAPPPRAPAPPGLFERAAPQPQRRRPAHAHAHSAPDDWAAAEDAALRRALRLQRLPADGGAPNWDWAAELVGDAAPARAYRSPRACRDRHDALADPERARRRHRRPPAARRREDDAAPRPPLARLEALRDAAERRRAAPRRHRDDPPPNPRHAALLADHGVDYDAPPTPVEVAGRRAERIAKEKLKAAAPSAPRVVLAAPPRAEPAPSPAPAPAPLGAAVRRARPPPPPASAASSSGAPAPLLYRQQAFPARHLKILHQTAASHAQGGPVADAPALRKLQLQQLALRRAQQGGPGQAQAQPARVVLAHLAPASAPAPHSAPAPAPAPDPRQPQ